MMLQEKAGVGTNTISRATLKKIFSEPLINMHVIVYIYRTGQKPCLLARSQVKLLELVRTTFESYIQLSL